MRAGRDANSNASFNLNKGDVILFQCVDSLGSACGAHTASAPLSQRCWVSSGIDLAKGCFDMSPAPVSKLPTIRLPFRTRVSDCHAVGLYSQNSALDLDPLPTVAMAFGRVARFPWVFPCFTLLIRLRNS